MAIDSKRNKPICTNNILQNIPEGIQQEVFDNILKTDQLRIERIVSTGHTSPVDFWYDQDWNEWVIVIQGRAVLEFLGEEKDLTLNQGDYVLIHAHKKHRVKWTDPTRKTIWLAIHFR